MRCSCQSCGEYMVQKDQGIESYCICPVCFSKCSMCMGTGTKVQSRDELKATYLIRLAQDSHEED